ncbi:GMC oxidoreductase [uncultured Roseobacter sp.]|uniref:GMC oxidoreductase n=1 Tax=uncultured Roseobacter sp. TaxID=114847 RepID=UPI002601786D|nr:GMC family oxidoreductase [uncultured Roseobacter sp.]
MTKHRSIEIAEAAEQPWDVIVIGAGMGGCAATYAIAQAGLRVLVLEKGQQDFKASATVDATETDPERRLSIGRWPHQISGVVDERRFDTWPPLGCGVGGSTLLYAAAVDRFRPVDFAPQTLPDGRVVSWPFDYRTLEPYYRKAEALLQVSGTPDPQAPQMIYDLAPPAEASTRDRWFMTRFARAGLNPYRLHYANLNRPGCDACLGRVCLKECKRNARNSFMTAALQSGRVSICEKVTVVRLNAEPDRVRSVRVKAAQGEVDLTAQAVVVAAGAYFTPVLLLNSANTHWPDGLANQNDQVGRNLMFHADLRIALWSKRGLDGTGPKKSIALRDFYERPDGTKFGEIQSTGAEARYGNVIYVLRQRFDQSRFARWQLLRHLLRIPALLADRLLGGATIFALILEDYPYPENRVQADPQTPSGMRFYYTIPQELRQRGRQLRKLVDQSFKGMMRLWLSYDLELNHGHPCGTCRAGNDPRTSVVDASGRAHGVQNLYVACGSVLATSGATNPSLTIAAVALRIGEQIAAQCDPSTRNAEGKHLQGAKNRALQE